MSSPFCVLTVKLDAIIKNWRMLRDHSQSPLCAAVVKADAYGLGVHRVASALYDADCRHFFVASVAEAVFLRSLLADDARIYSLSGFFPGEESDCIANSIIPVIVSYGMFKRWCSVTEGASKPFHCAIKVDTGMNRLGFSDEDFGRLLSDCEQSPATLSDAGVVVFMSHLACADDASHAQNTRQLEKFNRMLSRIRAFSPNIISSVANSSGLFLGEAFHFDMLRLGIALYGGLAEVSSGVYVAEPVVELKLPIIQVKHVSAGESVGYGATNSVPQPRYCAIVGAGYADGIFRSLSNVGSAYIGGHRVPFVGRVSMDSFVVDITALPISLRDSLQRPGTHYVELLGEHQSIDALAKSAGTISYEIITSFSQRFRRVYTCSTDVLGRPA